MVNQMTRTRSTGFSIEAPKETCTDKNCPFHGTLKSRGKHFTGKVVSDKMQRSVKVEWTGARYIPKYERYKKTKTAVIAHNPQCINAVEGDMVKIAECRPLGKTKNFVVLKVLGKADKHEMEKQSLEEGKHKQKKKEQENLEKESKESKSKDSDE